MTIEFSHLSVGYGDTVAVNDASFTLRDGTVHAVIGESGSGKSTLASALSGLLPLTASIAGQILLEGQDLLADSSWRGRVTRWSSRRAHPLRGRTIGTVPQAAATFLSPSRRVGAQLAETCMALDAGTHPRSLLVRCGLDPAVMNAYPHELSGGMAQRAALAFALAGSPTVIVADEPTSALDDLNANLVLDVVRAHATQGGTALVVTHDVQALLRRQIADDVTVMHHGKVVESGPSEQVLASPEAEYTRALLAALPENGLQLNTCRSDRESNDVDC